MCYLSQVFRRFSDSTAPNQIHRSATCTGSIWLKGQKRVQERQILFDIYITSMNCIFHYCTFEMSHQSREISDSKKQPNAIVLVLRNHTKCIPWAYSIIEYINRFLRYVYRFSYIMCKWWQSKAEMKLSFMYSISMHSFQSNAENHVYRDTCKMRPCDGNPKLFLPMKFRLNHWPWVVL